MKLTFARVLFGFNKFSEKGGNTSPASPVSKSSSIPSTPVSPSSPTSLKFPTTTDEQPSLTSSSNKSAEANNHVTSNNNGTIPESTNNTSTLTNGTLDTASSNKETSAVKMVNGAVSDGEGTAVTSDNEQGNKETPKVMEKGLDKNTDTNKDVTTCNMTATTSTSSMDANNNDTACAVGIEKKDEVKGDKSGDEIKANGQANGPEDKTIKETVEPSNSSGVDDDKKCKIETDGNNVESNGPVATAPSRGLNRPLHGILSQSKHANGELSDSKESPTLSLGGDDKEPGKIQIYPAEVISNNIPLCYIQHH